MYFDDLTLNQTGGTGVVPPQWNLVWSDEFNGTSINTNIWTYDLGGGGKVPAGSQHQATDAPPRSTVIRCLRPDGDIDYLRHASNPKAKPLLLLLHCPVF